MIGTLRSLLVLTLVGSVAALAPPAATAGQTQTFIVVLQPGGGSVRAEAASLARQYGGDLGSVYEHALRGFSITASSAAAAGLARNPRVSYVEADQVVSVEDQSTPTGVGRIFAAPSGTTVAEPIGGYNATLAIDGVDDWRVDVDVAVIDTGIDLDNPDLNVVDGVTCLSGSCVAGGDDDHYHGTHVSGTIAALDNGIGVVGVAPGARLWPVKVLNRRGSGSWSVVIAGIDWVAAHAAQIEVANMSLGGGKSQAVNGAVAGAVEAGVTMVVAAGNDSANIANYSPASEPKAITVSALADFNGLPGGGAASTCYPDQDDTFAGFSNYGTGVDIIAPGVCITSTNNNSTALRTISGTSMATPHVAGAAALLRSMGRTVSQTDALLKSSGNQGWSGDPDGSHEPLLDVHDAGIFAPALVAGSAGGGGGGGGTTNQPPTASFTSSCTDLACSFDGSGSSDPDGAVASYSWDFGDGGSSLVENPSHTYAVGGSYLVTLTVTDNNGATGPVSQTVTVAAPTGGLTFTGSSSQGPKGTWNATVTVSHGAAGATYSGTWSVDVSPSSCRIVSGTTCSITREGIPKRVGSVTWTYAGTPATVVTVLKP